MVMPSFQLSAVVEEVLPTLAMDAVEVVDEMLMLIFEAPMEALFSTKLTVFLYEFHEVFR